MWTVSEYKGGIPDINHFVPLLDRPCDVNDIIDCDSNSPFSATDIQPSTSGSNVSDCEEGCATDSDCSISVGDPCSDSVPLNDQLLTPIVGTPLPSGKHLPFAECVKTLLDTDNLTILPAVPSAMHNWNSDIDAYNSCAVPCCAYVYRDWTEMWFMYTFAFDLSK